MCRCVRACVCVSVCACVCVCARARFKRFEGVIEKGRAVKKGGGGGGGGAVRGSKTERIRKAEYQAPGVSCDVLVSSKRKRENV